MWADNAISTDRIDTIENFIAHRSQTMWDYIQENKLTSVFTMWYKSLMHSDLTTRGKRTKSTDGFERNLLYYLSVQQMDDLQRTFPEKRFESAKQSNIGLPDAFYKDLGVPRIQRRKGQQTEHHSWVSLNDSMKVYLVNDTTEYFTLDYTQKILSTLNKSMPNSWLSKTVELDENNPFTEFDLHEAIHGLGIEADTLFHSLRLNFFLNDTLIFIIEHNKEMPKLFLLLEKNPMFYSLLKLKDNQWVNHERMRRYQERALIKEGLCVKAPGKLHENEWDNVLLP